VSPIPNAVDTWRESPTSGAAVTLERLYLHYDAATAIWTLTNDPALESGRMADVDGSGTYVLLPLAAVAGRAYVTTRRADGTILSY
jgi:hypothetical protein